MVLEGYKETEIGVIPMEWDVVKVGRNTKLMGGYAFKSKDAKEYGTRWLKIANVGINTIKWEQTSYLQDNYKEEYKKFLLEKNDIVLAMTRPILSMKLKIAKITNNDIPALLNQRVGKFIFDDKVNSEFMYQLFQHIDFVKLLMLKIMGTDPPNVSSEQLESIIIPLPPLKEQEKIADILSTADEKIDAITSQIKKAETLKKGLLQKLLSEGIGHSEFKDSELGKIPESWELVELGSFSKSISKKNKDNTITDVVSVTKYDGIVNSLEYFNKKVFSDNITTYKIIERNQFAYATIHLDEGSIGFLDIFDIAVLSPMYSVFEIDYKRVDRSYFYSLVKSHKMIKIYEHIGLGSVERRKSISFNIFKKIKIPLPPLEEQKQIAEILSTADEKLEVLRAKKEKYETLKKGLLQKLLSGEVRV